VIRRSHSRLRLAAVLVSCAICLPSAAQKRAAQDEKQKAAGLPAVIWRDPGDVSKLDLFYGAGGKDDAPDPSGTYTFVKEDTEGTSPKFDVEDDQGRKWRVKLGQEPQSETAATRLLWAAGYFVDEDYFVAELKVEKLPRLRRGREFTSENGTVRRARLELRRKDIKKLGDWDWFNNPFDDTKELNGLRVMMCLINNWDLATNNNSIYEVGGERRYLVSDVGASFGKTGDSMSRSKSDVKGYTGAKFIDHTDAGDVDFVMHSRPLFITAFNVPNYHKRTKMQDVGRNIPIGDAKWIAGILHQFSASQIRDCFRAAGYDAKTTDEYTKTVLGRIAELNLLQPSREEGQLHGQNPD
jgi:hypothetical protein